MKNFGVIMPNWNKERYVGQAIDSVLTQSDPDWRLAVVDDSSTDGSITEIAHRVDRRIVVGVIEHRGPGAACRKAVELLRHKGVDHVGILDSDDALVPSAVRQVRQAYEENPDYGVVYTQNLRCKEDLSFIGHGRARALRAGETVLSTTETESSLPVNHWMTFSLAAYDRTAGFAELPRHHDMDLIFKLEEVTKFFFLDEPLYYYRDSQRAGKVVEDVVLKVREFARVRRAAQHSKMP